MYSTYFDYKSTICLSDLYTQVSNISICHFGVRFLNIHGANIDGSHLCNIYVNEIKVFSVNLRSTCVVQ